MPKLKNCLYYLLVFYMNVYISPIKSNIITYVDWKMIVDKVNNIDGFFLNDNINLLNMFLTVFSGTQLYSC